MRQTEEEEVPLSLPELEGLEKICLHGITDLGETEPHGDASGSQGDTISMDGFEVVQQSIVLGNAEFQAVPFWRSNDFESFLGTADDFS